jgi:dephospho-CoA kinase
MMLVIGILGGVASGKSLVSGELARLGAGLLDADRAGHEVLRMPAVMAAARNRWGERIFGDDGQINRKRLAEVVFSPLPDGPQERKFLEELTHAEIGRLLGEQARRMSQSGAVAAILDAPLLLEVHWDKFCGKLIFVDAPRELRLRRALARGWSEREFAVRESVQQDVESKRGRADLVVDNSGTPDQTREQVERLWRCLVG